MTVTLRPSPADAASPSRDTCSLPVQVQTGPSPWCLRRVESREVPSLHVL